MAVPANLLNTKPMGVVKMVILPGSIAGRITRLNKNEAPEM